MNNLIKKSQTKLDIITLGRIGIDLYAQQLNTPMENIKSFGKFIGGSPANIAVGTATLGLKTGFIGKVGDDGFTRYILDYFSNKGIDVSGISIDKSGANTQVAISEILSPEKANIIFYRENAADLKLSPSDISEDYIKSAKVLMISGTALAGSPSREAVFVAIEYARSNGVLVCIDIDYRPFNWKSADEASVYYSLVAEKCDIILGTREEFDVLEKFYFPNNKDDKKTADRFLDQSAKVVLIKHGKAGSRAYTKDSKIIDGVVFPAEVVNTFGAGDSYAASFLYGIINDYSISESMKFGGAASSIVVSRNDCSDAMPTFDEVLEKAKEKTQ